MSHPSVSDDDFVYSMLHPSVNDDNFVDSMLHPSGSDDNFVGSTLRPSAAALWHVTGVRVMAEQSESALGRTPAPSFEMLVDTLEKRTSSADIEALPIGAFAPVHYRDSVNDDWSPGVLLRQTAETCVVFDRTGRIQQHPMPCGFNDDGTPVDDGVTSEWTLTLAGKLIVHDLS
eukprot:6212805-Pleurochrysis_carterae.AAC.2